MSKDAAILCKCNHPIEDHEITACGRMRCQARIGEFQCTCVDFNRSYPLVIATKAQVEKFSRIKANKGNYWL